MKSVLMDVVLDDIAPKFGMMLSRSWEKRLGGTLQMDLYYATIPVFRGDYMRLCREVQIAHLVSDNKNTTNYPFYPI